VDPGNLEADLQIGAQFGILVRYQRYTGGIYCQLGDYICPTTNIKGTKKQLLKNVAGHDNLTPRRHRDTP